MQWSVALSWRGCRSCTYFMKKIMQQPTKMYTHYIFQQFSQIKLFKYYIWQVIYLILASLTYCDQAVYNNMKVCVYRRVSVVDDLPHEISIKHSFGYNGEPCEEVTHTQSPQLPRHLSVTLKKESIKTSRWTWRRNFTKKLQCQTCCAYWTVKYFQFTSPSTWITRAVEQLYPCQVLPRCWSQQMTDCWLTAETPAGLQAVGGRSDRSNCGRWWLAVGSKVLSAAVDNAVIPLVHSRRKWRRAGKRKESHQLFFLFHICKMK